MEYWICFSVKTLINENNLCTFRSNILYIFLLTITFPRKHCGVNFLGGFDIFKNISCRNASKEDLGIGSWFIRAYILV